MPFRLNEFSNEEFKVWFQAYSKNYGETGLMGSETIAKQAWLAAMNCAVQIAECFIEEEMETMQFGGSRGGTRAFKIAQVLRAQK